MFIGVLILDLNKRPLNNSYRFGLIWLNLVPYPQDSSFYVVFWRFLWGRDLGSDKMILKKGEVRRVKSNPLKIKEVRN